MSLDVRPTPGWVVDATVVLDLLLGGARSARVLEALRGEGARPGPEPHLHALEGVDLEVMEGLAALVDSGRMTGKRARASVRLLPLLPLRRHPVTPLLPRIWELRHHRASTQAGSVALAEVLGLPILTCDPHVKTG
jgi:predicted nucleic acid-binding protein